jgi:uncharacterized membrane protein YphA (DoxX/SURF4 family)
MLNGLAILNPFPELLTLEMYAPLILRLVLGIILINVGYLVMTKERPRWRLFIEGLGLKPQDPFVSALGIIEIVSGAMLVLGFYTQIAALAIVVITFVEAYAEYKESVLVKRNIVFYLLILAIAFSLLLTGAGAFSLDLPL